MSQIYLMSSSQVKISSIKNLKLIDDDNLIPVELVIDPTVIPSQPVGINGGLGCAIKRIELFKQLTGSSDSKYKNFNPMHDVIISVENFIVEETRKDVCCVVIELNNITTFGYSSDDVNPTYPEKYADELGNIMGPLYYEYNNTQMEIKGYATTMGKIINKHNQDIQHDNWSQQYGGMCRMMQIKSAYDQIDKTEFIKNFIRIVPNHPSPNIMFSDLTPLFANVITKNMLYQIIYSKISEKITNCKIDYVVGLDARGFINGSVIAEKLNAGFVTMRKSGKLGGTDCYSANYGKEYGKDSFEIVSTIMKPNKNILIVDDVIATGGTFIGAKTLCEKFQTNQTNQTDQKIFALAICEIKELKELAKEKMGNFYDDVIVCI